ncbi:hypothetical protein [Bacillus mycoides]|uniref:hypothetical protein n=1 Tax=Bacillus mycoides TaxID=1405 RepID=UPI001041D003|nr:hypothetical protein [Bacillus mycoides]
MLSVGFFRNAGGTPDRVILDIALYDSVESKSEIARKLAKKMVRTFDGAMTAVRPLVRRNRVV